MFMASALVMNQYDPEAKRQSSIWVFPGEPAPMKFKQSRSVAKQIVVSLFSKKGHIVSIQLQKQRTATANCYFDVCILRAFQSWENGCPKTGLRGLLWHHDNASAHVAAKTIDLLTKNVITLLRLFTISCSQGKVKGIHFSTPEEARRTYEDVALDIPQDQNALISGLKE